MLGCLPGSVVVTERLRVINLALDGALVESPQPVRLNAEYRMQLVLAGQVGEVLAKVRRVTELAGPGGLLRYRLGVEFVAVRPETQDALLRFVAAGETAV